MERIGIMQKYSWIILLAISTLSYAQGGRGESFDDFFLEFRESAEYQKSRVQFPLPSITIHMETERADTSKVEKTAWKFNDFKLIRSGVQVRLFDTFDRKMRDSDERVVSIIGNDNGVYYSYFFKRIDGRWFLVRILDEST